MINTTLPKLTLIITTLLLLFSTTTINADIWYEDFENGIPADWLTEDYYSTGSAFMWTTEDHGDRGNNTGGSGLFVIGDSDYFFGAYDIGLVTPSFNVEPNSVLSFDTDYQRWIDDPAEVDITTDNGNSWINLLSWNEDHQGPENVEVSLTDYAGENARIRFHYSHLYGFAWNKWWEIDNVAVNVIPTPASYIILLTAIGIIVIRRRK